MTESRAAYVSSVYSSSIPLKQCQLQSGFSCFKVITPIPLAYPITLGLDLLNLKTFLLTSKYERRRSSSFSLPPSRLLPAFNSSFSLKIFRVFLFVALNAIVFLVPLTFYIFFDTVFGQEDICELSFPPPFLRISPSSLQSPTCWHCQDSYIYILS